MITQKKCLNRQKIQRVWGEINTLESQLGSKTQTVNSANPSQQQLNGLVKCYQTGSISASLVASQKSVQLVSQDAEAHHNLSITLQDLGRLDIEHPIPLVVV